MNLASLDSMFSRLIRERAGWRCEKCNRPLEMAKDLLHCSHFWSRVNKSTRFDPDNCAALCWLCHHDLDGHPNEHRAWKRFKLGDKRFEALALRARKIVKVSIEDIREQIEKFRADLAEAPKAPSYPRSM